MPPIGARLYGAARAGASVTRFSGVGGVVRLPRSLPAECSFDPPPPGGGGWHSPDGGGGKGNLCSVSSPSVTFGDTSPWRGRTVRYP
ncbi:MAG: hypothetical protein DI640_10780 [Sphingomonas taxi]|uniref:Uncharacterized protein n=1 Tax=Sphingomonas taxi TaxID=1549858 RepID=A0A2W4YSD8_9SPHN|nr:MAG: hypothetical protein DI640_10780 [Sphingomonas taxi]